MDPKLQQAIQEARALQAARYAHYMAKRPSFDADLSLHAIATAAAKVSTAPQYPLKLQRRSKKSRVQSLARQQAESQKLTVPSSYFAAFWRQYLQTPLEREDTKTEQRKRYMELWKSLPKSRPPKFERRKIQDFGFAGQANAPLFVAVEDNGDTGESFGFYGLHPTDHVYEELSQAFFRDIKKADQNELFYKALMLAVRMQ